MGRKGDGLGTKTVQALEMGETQGQKSTTACRREQVTWSPLHQPGLAKDVARAQS